MDSKQEFLKMLIETFKQEAEEGIKKMTTSLLKLEKSSSKNESKELIEIIYREAHSLKGAARAVNLTDIESICQSFENVMSAVKVEKIILNTIVFDTLNDTIDIISIILKSQSEPPSEALKSKIKLAIRNLSEIEAGDVSKIKTGGAISPDQKQKQEKQTETKNINAFGIIKPIVKNVKKESNIPSKKELVKADIDVEKSTSETIRISTLKLDNLLFQAEEMLSMKLSALQQIQNMDALYSIIEIWTKEYSIINASIQNIKQHIEKKEKYSEFSNEEREIGKIIQFFEWSNSQLNKLKLDFLEQRKFTAQEAYESGSKIDGLLDDVKKLITVPFSSVIDTLPKAIRDISRDLGKKVDVEIVGQETEIDRRILEILRHPLMHIIRNNLDYGIEKPEIRIKNNKSPIGKISIHLERLENNKIQLEIADDGAGINIDKLRKLYCKNENLSDSEADNISEEALLYYIFKSGVSTSDIITDLSGRGLGLAIVQEKIDQLGGSITVSSVKNRGTQFKIEIPLSLVAFRGILIKAEANEFVIPTAKIVKVIRVNKNEIQTVENKETLLFNGRIIPFVKLVDVLSINTKAKEFEFVPTLILETNAERIALAVDEIYGEQEILLKKFNKHLGRVKNISGATVLGSGKVVPILNAYDLIKSANVFKNNQKLQKTNIQKNISSKSVLVVEDSITSRTLLKNILESAGYKVATAIDGVDGFTKLKTQKFDVVISDIEMPRMNGFELTEKIRSDKDLAKLPLILITSLSKREDQEKGIEVGADAYIIKSSFDQSNLLEIVDRMI